MVEDEEVAASMQDMSFGYWKLRAIALYVSSPRIIKADC